MTIVSEAKTTDDEIPEGHHVLSILDATGDTRITWDPNNTEDVDNARATFERLVGEKKYTAYAVDRRGNKGEVVRTFDPTAEKLILAPALHGG